MSAPVSVDVPYAITAALPSLSVLDITNDIARKLADAHLESGIAYIWPTGRAVIRVNEREAGFFEDLETLLERLVPVEARDRTLLLAFLLGPQSTQVPFTDGRLCLGRWQRVLLFSFDEGRASEWTLTLLG